MRKTWLALFLVALIAPAITTLNPSVADSSQTPESELNVNFDVDACAQRHAGLGDRVEAGERGFDAIFADRHIRKRVEAGFVRDGAPVEASTHAGQRHLDTGKDAARAVLNHA